MEHTNPLGTEKISRLLVHYSVPAIVGMVVNALYNIVDRIFIGNSPDLGSLGIAGITIGFPIMIVLMSIGILFGVGGATLYSIRQGEGKDEEAYQVLGNACSLLIIFGLLFLILGQIFLKPLLTLFGASKEVLPYSVEYMRIIFFGAVFQTLSMGMNNFLRADGQPRLAMITMFMGAGTNIVLDPLFIFVFKMGMAGAALATIISQALSAAWILSYFLSKRGQKKLTLKRMKLQPALAHRITSLGMPGFLMQLANSLLNLVLNKTLYKYGGDIAISGMGIVNSLQNIVLMPIIGIKQGVQAILSFNYGAKKYDRVKTAAMQVIFAATAIVVVGFIVIQLVPEKLVSLFNRDPALVAFGSYALRTWFLCLPVIGFQIMGATFFQAIGRSRSAMFLNLARQVVLLIPAVMIFAHLWGLDGVLYAAPFSDALAAIITGLWFLRAMKGLR